MPTAPTTHPVDVIANAIRATDGSLTMGAGALAEAVAAAGTVTLAGDQVDAIRALLDLVHYDDLAASWAALLPDGIRPGAQAAAKEG